MDLDRQGTTPATFRGGTSAGVLQLSKRTGCRDESSAACTLKNLQPGPSIRHYGVCRIASLQPSVLAYATIGVWNFQGSRWTPIAETLRGGSGSGPTEPNAEHGTVSSVRQYRHQSARNSFRCNKCGAVFSAKPEPHETIDELLLRIRDAFNKHTYGQTSLVTHVF
jgi:hypothetical protein